MNRKLILFIASSLDGYIATKDDSVAWLEKIEGEGDNGFSEFYDTVDTVLLGRRTYDWIVEQELARFPYEDKKCYVFSRKSAVDDEHVTFVHEDAATFVEKLKRKSGKKIWLVGGGKLFQSLFEQHLIDEIILTITPVILGKGIPLFQESNIEKMLFLKQTRRLNQFVQLHYEVCI